MQPVILHVILDPTVAEYSGPDPDTVEVTERQADLARFIQLALGPRSVYFIRDLRLQVEMLGDGQVLVHGFSLGAMSTATRDVPPLCHFQRPNCVDSQEPSDYVI